MDRYTEITEPVFNALRELQRKDAPATALPELIHQKMCTYLEQCTRLGTKLGISQPELDEVRFALAALVDEVVVSKGGKLREFWLTNLLQMRYFGQNVAGDALFERLTVRLRDASY